MPIDSDVSSLLSCEKTADRATSSRNDNDVVVRHPRPFSDHSIMSKRRRPNPRMTLSDLPFEAVTSIFRYLQSDLSDPGLPTPLSHIHSDLSGSGLPTPLSHIRQLAPLRLLNSLFRDAFDAHVTSLDLSDISRCHLGSLLSTILPRLHNITFLSLPMCALSGGLHECWHHFLQTSRARLQHLMFVNSNSISQSSPPANDAIPPLLANAFRSSLERITTNSESFLSAFSNSPQNVHSLQLQMDQISETKLLPFSSLSTLKLLYRVSLTRERAQLLVNVLQSVRNPSLHVHLRLNRFPSSYFTMFPHIPGLHKVSLFDGVIEETNRGMFDLASCPHLEDIQFEWTRHLSGQDIMELANIMRHRLKKLLIWRCEHVTDQGLLAIANLCPNAEVELRFARDQFSPQALAALGDRVSWGSSIT